MHTLTLFLLVCLLCSCQETVRPKNAEETFKAFQLAVNVMDIGYAQQLATESTKQQLQLLAVDMKMSSDKEIAAKKKKLFAEIKTLKCKGEAPNVNCSLCCDIDGKEKTAKLVQLDGNWFVEMDFEMADK
jgi:hypothetical protein